MTGGANDKLVAASEPPASVSFGWTWAGAILFGVAAYALLQWFPSPLWGIVPASQNVKDAFNGMMILGVFLFIPIVFLACLVLHLIRRTCSRASTRAVLSACVPLVAVLGLSALRWDPSYMPGVTRYLVLVMQPGTLLLAIPITAASIYVIRAREYSLLGMLGLAALSLAVATFLFMLGHVLVGGENG